MGFILIIAFRYILRTIIQPFQLVRGIRCEAFGWRWGAAGWLIDPDLEIPYRRLTLFGTPHTVCFLRCVPCSIEHYPTYKQGVEYETRL